MAALVCQARDPSVVVVISARVGRRQELELEIGGSSRRRPVRQGEETEIVGLECGVAIVSLAW